jgi:uncharacterized protein YcbK (DUF882 family)
MEICMINWIREFSPDEWPDNVTEQMSPTLFHKGLFPLRQLSGIPMTPSQLAAAHVRTEGQSRHSTHGGTRLSDATDIHVGTTQAMLNVFTQAQRIEDVGGIGIYFDTNRPMFHIDMRPERLLWHRTKEGHYIYLSDSATTYEAIRFYHSLANEIERAR